jgi:hypothetical protein
MSSHEASVVQRKSVTSPQAHSDSDLCLAGVSGVNVLKFLGVFVPNTTFDKIPWISRDLHPRGQTSC